MEVVFFVVNFVRGFFLRYVVVVVSFAVPGNSCEKCLVGNRAMDEGNFPIWF